MANDNSLTIIGTLTRDPELRYTTSGATVANLGIARNPRVKQGNEWVDGDPQFYDVTAWGSLAENVAESLIKGQRVIVFGELEFRTWEADGGEKRSKVSIKAEAIGPDLRWATADVTKVQSSSSGGSSSGRAPSGRSSGSKPSRDVDPFGSSHDGEEPF